MLHVLAGDAERDAQFLLKARSGRPFPWIVPMGAQVGERVLFHLPSYGFVGRAAVGSEPRIVRHKKYSAKIRDFILFPTSVPLAFIRDNQPEWGWPRYPRTYTTIDGTSENRLNALLESYQASITGEGNDAESAEDHFEGKRKSVMITIYERNPTARRECINHYGAICFVCGFSFGKF
jgi:hypothetical protein